MDGKFTEKEGTTGQSRTLVLNKMKKYILYSLCIFLSIVVVKWDYEAYKGLRYLFNSNSVNPYEGAVIVLAATVISSMAWIPLVGLIWFQRKQINKYAKALFLTPTLLLFGMLAIAIIPSI